MDRCRPYDRKPRAPEEKQDGRLHSPAGGRLGQRGGDRLGIALGVHGAWFSISAVAIPSPTGLRVQERNDKHGNDRVPSGPEAQPSIVATPFERLPFVPGRCHSYRRSLIGQHQSLGFAIGCGHLHAVAILARTVSSPAKRTFRPRWFQPGVRGGC